MSLNESHKLVPVKNNLPGGGTFNTLGNCFIKHPVGAIISALNPYLDGGIKL